MGQETGDSAGKGHLERATLRWGLKVAGLRQCGEGMAWVRAISRQHGEGDGAGKCHLKMAGARQCG